MAFYNIEADDLDLAAERAIVRGSKPSHDRVVFLTPALIEALNHYLEKRPVLLLYHIGP